MRKIIKWLTAERRKARIVRRILTRYLIPIYDESSGIRYAVGLIRKETFDVFIGTPILGPWLLSVGWKWHGVVFPRRLFDRHGKEHSAMEKET